MTMGLLHAELRPKQIFVHLENGIGFNLSLQKELLILYFRQILSLIIRHLKQVNFLCHSDNSTSYFKRAKNCLAGFYPFPPILPACECHGYPFRCTGDLRFPETLLPLIEINATCFR